MIYVFEGFRLDTKNRRLTRLDTSAAVSLTPKVAELLTYMVENSGRVLAKDELLEAVWKNAFVEESNLSQSIFVLRKALGEDNKNPSFILTVPNRGYKFIAPVVLADSVNEPPGGSNSFEEIVPNRPDPDLPVRYQRAGRSGPALWIVTPLILLAFFLGIVFSSNSAVRRGSTEPPKDPSGKSLAVLPVKNLTGNSGDEFFADGLTESLITEIAKIHGLTVISRNSSFELKGKPDETVTAVRNRFEVTHFLENSLRRDGASLRLESRLVEAASGTVIWSNTFEQNSAEILTMQDGIACNVASDIRSTLCGQRDKETQKYQTSLKAYQTYLKGRFYYYQRGTEPLFKAVTEFQKTLAIDPKYAPAYSALAEAYMTMEVNGVIGPGEGFPTAEQYARQAIELDATLPGSYNVLAIVGAGKVSPEETEALYQKAIEANSNYAPTWQRRSRFYWAMGRFGEAEAGLRKAQQLDPLSLSVNYNLGELYLFERDYDKALAQAEHIFSIFPDNFGGYQIRAAALDGLGRYEEALTAAEKTHEINRNLYKAKILAHVGRRAEAKELIANMENSEQGKRSVAIAELYAQVGEIDTAFIWLERAVTMKESAVGEIKINPDLDLLRNDPRFQELEIRAGIRQ